MRWRDTASTVITLFAITAGAVYLVARATTLGNGGTLALSIPLYLAELIAFAQFSLFAFVAWHAHQRMLSPARNVASHQGSRGIDQMDIVVDARAKSNAQLERTLVGARSVKHVGSVIVIDDEHRPEIAEITDALGASYVSDRATDEQCIDALIEVSSTELVGWLEAGQVPMPDFLAAAALRLADPAVGVWQSPIGLLNVDSFAHMQHGRDEDGVVRSIVAPGLDSFGVAPWTGPGSVVRRHPIELLGSFVDSPSPIGQRLVSLQRAGWKTACDSEPFVRAIAPDDLDDYLVTRRAHATAALGVFATRSSPLLVRGLSPIERLSHVVMASMFVTGIRQVLVVLVIIGTLLSGHFPIAGPLAIVLGLWATATATTTLSRRLLAGDAMEIGDWTRHGWRTVGADLAALGSLVSVRNERTNKDRHGATGLRTLGRLRVLTGVIIALDIAMLLRGATLIFEDLLPPFTVGHRVSIMAVGLFTLVPMVDVLHLVVSRKQRRKNFRLEAELDVRVGDHDARTIDLSTSGVGVLLPFSPVVGTTLDVRISLPNLTDGQQDIDVTGKVRAANLDSTGMVRVGLEFGELEAQSRQALIEFCMVTTAPGDHHTELTEPRSLTIHRPVGHRVHSVRSLTAVASMASLAMLFLGPSPASASEVEFAISTITVVDTTGTGVADATIRLFADGTDRWRTAGTTDSSGTVAFQLSDDAADAGQTSAAVEWLGARLVFDLRTGDSVVTLSRIDAGNASVNEINLGPGWVEFVDGMQILPGRVAIRFADDSVLKMIVEPSSVLDVSTGEQRRVEASQEAATTTAVAPAPTSSTDVTTSAPTVEATTTTTTTTTTVEPTTTTTSSTTSPSTTDSIAATTEASPAELPAEGGAQ